MTHALPAAWRRVLGPEICGLAAAIEDRVDSEAGQETIYPPLVDRYRALELVAPADVRVVISTTRVTSLSCAQVPPKFGRRGLMTTSAILRSLL
jgi:hypothetical protein